MKYSESEKDKALQDFRFYHSELLAALNGIKRPVAGDQEVADLRRKLLSAKYVCEKMGVEAQTLWEFAQEKRKESEGKVRQFAIAQSAITPVVSRQLRQQLPWSWQVWFLFFWFISFRQPWGLLAQSLLG